MSNSVNQLNQRISNLYALVGQGGGGGSADLSQVLANGNSAGTNDLNMNNNDITNVTTINGFPYIPNPTLQNVLNNDGTSNDVPLVLTNSGPGSMTLDPGTGLSNTPTFTITNGTLTNVINSAGMSANAATATTATTATRIGTLGVTQNQAFYLPFVATTATTSSQQVYTDTNGHITFNPSTNQLTTTGAMVNSGMTMNGNMSQFIINNASATAAISAPNAQLISFPSANVTATTFTGALVGNADSATNAYNTLNVTTTDNNQNENCFIPFQKKATLGFTSPLFIDEAVGPLTYNPITSTLNANNLTGIGSVSVSTGTQMTALLTNISFSYVSGIYTYFVFNNTATTATILSSTINNVDLLLIGGGGSGGFNGIGAGSVDSAGGGGGAGGYTLVQNTSITAGTYSIAIGTGGVAPPSGSVGAPGNSGNPTTAFGYTALGGGGGGGGSISSSGLNGGSGGGGNANGVLQGANVVGAGGSSTAVAPSVGFAGGNGLGFGGGGGGGGAGAAGGAGGNTSTLIGGAGGIGTLSTSTWLSAGFGGINNYTGNNAMSLDFKTATNAGYIAGGGGGSARNGNFSSGLGGNGGGGNGYGSSSASTIGVVNTGGGGGGGCAVSGAIPRNGGSGLIIIRAITANLPSATPITATLTATGLSFNSITPNILINANLPTSSTGLPAGTIFRDGASANAFLKIV